MKREDSLRGPGSQPLREMHPTAQRRRHQRASQVAVKRLRHRPVAGVLVRRQLSIVRLFIG